MNFSLWNLLAVIVSAAVGAMGLGGGMVLLQFLDTRYIRWIFAAFLLTLGIITFFQKEKKE